MDKKLKQHATYIEAKIADYKRLPSPAKTQADYREQQMKLYEVYRFHIDTVHDLQHERLIHLLVTFFFGGLLLAALAETGLVMMTPIMSYGISLATLAIVLDGILLLTELFYIRHYYQLENGVQGLYKLTEKLHELTTSIPE